MKFFGECFTGEAPRWIIKYANCVLYFIKLIANEIPSDNKQKQKKVLHAMIHFYGLAMEANSLLLGQKNVCQIFHCFSFLIRPLFT